MDNRRGQQVEDIFNAAARLTGIAREKYLADVCAQDSSLRAEVESLIRSFEGPTVFHKESVLQRGQRFSAAKVNLSAGDSIGIYEIVSVLGVGGMGSVYLAYDPRLGRKVALKVLPPDLIEDEERVRRFRQEARAASKISHPN